MFVEIHASNHLFFRTIYGINPINSSFPQQQHPNLSLQERHEMPPSFFRINTFPPTYPSPTMASASFVCGDSQFASAVNLLHTFSWYLGSEPNPAV
mmetsp:Transcript_19480/g.30018  ORF Transcript_19480/g.30018 Transcript_19480/m.30018 type:complete len:96 (-) Transcript_19480:63-350(-)